MTLGESLKRFRLNFGLTQKQVAKELGIFPQTYQTYEGGKKIPAATILIKIAEKFNVSLDYLAGLSDNPRPTQIDDNEVREALALKNALKGVLQEHGVN